MSPNPHPPDAFCVKERRQRLLQTVAELEVTKFKQYTYFTEVFFFKSLIYLDPISFFQQRPMSRGVKRG
jgi:hypothetical protein